MTILEHRARFGAVAAIVLDFSSEAMAEGPSKATSDTASKPLIELEASDARS